MEQESWGRRIWRLIYPGLTYFGICFIVEVIATVLIAMTAIAGIDPASAGVEERLFNEMWNRALSMALELQILSAAITLPILILYYKRDRKRDRAAGRDRRYTAVPAWQFIFIVILGFAACLAGNNLITASGLYTVSDTYAEISEILYGGKLVLEFVGLGILVPIVEEFIFRGLIYRRLREYLNIGPAAVICSVIFSLYHGNLVQGVYAFLLSLLFIYCYERYHTMAAPILFHAAANILSVAVSELGVLNVMYTSLGAFWTGTILSCLILIVMVYLIERFVHSEEIGGKQTADEETTA
ncbi:MAG TPA: CPBP family intramembrane metalloprotease [Firmicutes bacterium]|nr:CPBP family intramembrane metalloprotease [Bacillota bacterium]